MKLSRYLLPLLLALALLLAQQGGATHSLIHALAKQTQQDKHLPQSSPCEQCEVYAQLSSALNSAGCSLLVSVIPADSIRCGVVAFHSILPPAAIARGPPALLRNIA